MTPQHEDGLLDSIVGDALETVHNRTPQEVARDRADSERHARRMATPLVDRMLAACQRADKVRAREAMNLQASLARKDVLTNEDRDALREAHRILEDHPVGCYGTLDNLLLLRGLGPAWLEEYIQEELWTWAWWSDHYGMTDEEHMTAGGTEGRPRDQIEAVTASRPYPEGWLPVTRRGNGR